MAMFLVRRKAGQGGVTTLNDGDAALVVAADAAAARTAAAAGEVGGAAAWADADAFPFDEANLTENGGVVRFQTTSATPSTWEEAEPEPDPG